MVLNPITGQKWAKDKSIFSERGGVSYDTDWYNGLTLSGLYRALQCSDPHMYAPAARLAKGIAKERELMINYFTIFCDWSLGCAWSDPRGEVLDFDCSHNGLEGLLAQAGICELENDTKGRDFSLYLAGRASVIYLASHDLAPWYAKLARDHQLDHIPSPEDSFGWRGYR